ncbi:DUF4192 domain-containing protein [Nocardioides solisilvae]|uniref:DUF4192 domain-containing protein n=1 Tax=Nocardioides solisilvae TaxID=1542435 RepID=UPI0013A54E52|nr:DUF4192 domain-containing protein [Nocardioides solisilvae]
MENRLDLVARTPEDLLACVPLALGFVPEQSVVMIGLGRRSVPHARVDLGAPEDLPEVCEALVAPAVQHGAEEVALSVWGDLDAAVRPAGGLRRAFEAAGIPVPVVLAHDGTAWAVLDPPARGPATPFDVLAHPFVTEAVVAGRVVHRSRRALARTLAPDPARVEATARALLMRGRQVPPPRRVRQVATTVLAGGGVPGPGDVALLVAAAGSPPLRDALWHDLSADEARRQVDLWLAVVRATPAALRAAPAAVLAACAWRAGDGALAWCAVDLARAAPGECPLTEVVAHLLATAAAPDTRLPG